MGLLRWDAMRREGALFIQHLAIRQQLTILTSLYLLLPLLLLLLLLLLSLLVFTDCRQPQSCAKHTQFRGQQQHSASALVRFNSTKQFHSGTIAQCQFPKTKGAASFARLAEKKGERENFLASLERGSHYALQSVSFWFDCSFWPQLNIYIYLPPPGHSPNSSRWRKHSCRVPSGQLTWPINLMPSHYGMAMRKAWRIAEATFYFHS